MGYIVFGNDERMNYVRTMLAAEETGVPCCVFAPNIILSGEDVKKIPWGASVFAGGVDTEGEKSLTVKNILLRKYGDSEKFTLKNAEITAEAVLSLILGKTDKLLKECKILVVGFGKCGKAVCKYLFGLAADFTVMTSKPQNSVIYTTAVDYGADISKYDFIINTAPARVITEQQLDSVKKTVSIIDIASKPYGLDHGFAVAHGIDSAVYPALPSRLRPYSAAKTMVSFITEECCYE